MLVLHPRPYGDACNIVSQETRSEAIWDEIPVRWDEHTGRGARVDRIAGSGDVAGRGPHSSARTERGRQKCISAAPFAPILLRRYLRTMRL